MDVKFTSKPTLFREERFLAAVVERRLLDRGQVSWLPGANFARFPRRLPSSSTEPVACGERPWITVARPHRIFTGFPAPGPSKFSTLEDRASRSSRAPRLSRRAVPLFALFARRAKTSQCESSPSRPKIRLLSGLLRGFWILTYLNVFIVLLDFMPVFLVLWHAVPQTLLRQVYRLCASIYDTHFTALFIHIKRHQTYTFSFGEQGKNSTRMGLVMSPVALIVNDLRKARCFDRAERDLFCTQTDEGVTSSIIGEGSARCLNSVG